MPRSLQALFALLFFLPSFVAVNHTSAQSAVASEPRIVNGGSNEDSKAELDLLAQTSGGDKLIILISRRGTRESSRIVSRSRLKTASRYLQNVRAVEKQRIVVAEGEPVAGEGRIEAYLDGKLFMTFVFRRNKDFAHEG